MPVHDTLLVAAICASALSILLVAIGMAVASMRLGRLTNLLETSLKQVQEETCNTLQTTQDVLVRLEELARNLDKLVTAEMAPALAAARETLQHVEAATRAVGESASSVRSIVESVKTVAKPATFAATATRALAAPAGRASMLALALGAALRALLASRHSPDTGKIAAVSTHKGER